MKRDDWHKINEFVNRPDLLSMASPSPSAELIDKLFPIIRKRLLESMRVRGSQVFNYSDNQGDAELRIELADSGLLGMNAESEEIIITNGGQEGIKMTIEAAVLPGETVLLEKRSYIGVEQPLIDRGAVIRSLKKDLNDYVDDELEEQIRLIKPKLFYLVTDFASPNGSCVGSKLRKLISKLADRYEFWVLEDVTYKPLDYEGMMSNEFLSDMTMRAITTGSATKIIVPGLRIGWLKVRNSEFRRSLITKKESYSLSSPLINQSVLSLILKKDLKGILKISRKHYKERMERLDISLRKYLPTGFSWVKPGGGFYLELVGGENFHASGCLTEAIEEGVSFMPSRLFDFSGDGKDESIRLSISNLPIKHIEDAVKRLALALKKYR